ncbi:class I SAM-dependent methyltransferase [Pseudidiomarina sp. PP-1MA]|uniref:Class I SAM-dependent methyltransferase n=1 Tax=Pseudidiomarina sp. PP-1MA TaxID=3237706 RepID=A0AB39X8W1_9GAMM
MKYFNCFYPKNGNLSRLLGIRKGYNSRAQLIKKITGNMSGKHVIDIGCGDGSLLVDIIQGTPSTVTLIDSSERFLQIARENESLQVLNPTYICTNGFHYKWKNPSLVLMIGVLDYSQNWINDLNDLLVQEFSGKLIFSLPVKDNWSFRFIIRRLWLRLWGIKLQSCTYSDLNKLMHQVEVKFLAVRCEYDWIINVEDIY